MAKDKTLRYTRLLLRIFTIVYIFFFVLFLALVVYWHIYPDDFGNVDMSSGFKAGFAVTNIKFSPDNMPPKAIVLSDLSHAMMYWLVFRNTVFFVLGLLILRRINAVLHSIKTLETFYHENIQHFRTIGKLCFIIVGISFFNFYYDGKLTVDLTLPFTPLLFGAASYMMAEVFKEGLALAEDNKSII